MGPSSAAPPSRVPGAPSQANEIRFYSLLMSAVPVVPRFEAGTDLRPAVGRVLVVDDAPANVALLQQLLSREGHVVLTAADGVEALAIVQRGRPDRVPAVGTRPGGVR